MRSLTLLLLTLGATAAAQDYADDGPLTVAVTTGSVTVQMTSFSYDLYSPATGGPWPIIALGHGFSNSKTAMQGLARALASRGNFVVVPQFPFLDSNHARNGQALLAALDAVAAAQPVRADASRQAVAGHSAGGLSAMLAAVNRQSLRAVVELDGVDASPALTAAQLSAVRAPALLLSAPAAMCNSQNNSAAWYASLTVPRGRFRITSALHCDPTEPTDATCTFGCPGTDAQRTRRFKRAAVAWLQYFVSCELAARTSIDGAEFQAAKGAGLVGADQFDAMPAAPCAPPDGGAGGAGGGAAGGSAGGSAGGAAAGSAGGTAGGSAGGAAGGSAGGAASGGNGAGGGGATKEPRGCGCSTGSSAWLLIAALGVRARRSRSARRAAEHCRAYLVE